MIQYLSVMPAAGNQAFNPGAFQSSTRYLPHDKYPGLVQNVQHQAKEMKLLLSPTQIFSMNLVCIVLLHEDHIPNLTRVQRRCCYRLVAIAPSAYVGHASLFIVPMVKYIMFRLNSVARNMHLMRSILATGDRRCKKRNGETKQTVKISPKLTFP